MRFLLLAGIVCLIGCSQGYEDSASNVRTYDREFYLNGIIDFSGPTVYSELHIATIPRQYYKTMVVTMLEAYNLEEMKFLYDNRSSVKPKLNRSVVHFLDSAATYNQLKESFVEAGVSEKDISSYVKDRATANGLLSMLLFKTEMCSLYRSSSVLVQNDNSLGFCSKKDTALLNYCYKTPDIENFRKICEIYERNNN